MAKIPVNKMTDIQKDIKKEMNKDSLYDETRHWIRFQNNENPNGLLEFSFGKTVVRPNGKKSIDTERWAFVDGKVYEMPQYIIEHLNKLMVPDPIFEKLPNGYMKVDNTRKRNRFSCVHTTKPVEVDEEAIV